MWKILVIIVALCLGFTSTAEARYCNNPYCAMCNRIFGPMPGYQISNDRVSRAGSSTSTVSRASASSSSRRRRLFFRTQRSPLSTTQATTTTRAEAPRAPQTAPVAAPIDLSEDTTFEPIPQEAIEPMLKLLAPTRNEVLYDLGCGDGRILIEAVKSFGCKAVGIELNPETAALAKKNVLESGVGNIRIVQGNVKHYELSGADIITMYLFPDLIVELKDHIKSGTRVISFAHQIPGEDVVEWQRKIGDTEYKFYVWTKK